MIVAIIGAGFSGMVAAYLLEKAGVKVTVYEKENTLGGHCKTLINGGSVTEIGTVFAFPDLIKELLIELKLTYTERFTHRIFLDEHYQQVEHVPSDEIGQLMNELAVLSEHLMSYRDMVKEVAYGQIPKELSMPLSDYLDANNLNTIAQVIAPHFSSFGFGSIHEVQAYYAFKIFDTHTIETFIKSDKLLYVKDGTAALIDKLAESVKDIRYAMPVRKITTSGERVGVKTDYDEQIYDKVLITTKLPDHVIEDDFYTTWMSQLDTNPYVTYVYEAVDRNLSTTYFKANLGHKDKIQFFHTFKQSECTFLVAYVYGYNSESLSTEVRRTLEAAQIKVKRLVTAKQWHIFPHLKVHQLSLDYYEQVLQRKDHPIQPIGALITKPSLSHLYQSVKQSVEALLV